MKNMDESRGPHHGPLACESARIQAAAWRDGESPASQALLGHLESCDECRLYVEDLGALSARLASLAADEPSADLWTAIAARAAAVVQRPNPWPARLLRVAAAVIACAGTTALLQLSASMEQRPRAQVLSTQAGWPAALHDQGPAAHGIRSAPEQRLLAALALTTQGKR